MTDHIMYVLDYSIQIIIYLFLMNQLMKPRFNFVKMFSIYFISMTLVYMFYLYSESSRLFQSIFKNSITVFFVYFMYKDSLLKKTAVYIGTTLGSLVLTIPVEKYVCELLNVNIDKLSEATLMRTAGMMFFQDALLIICLLVCIVYTHIVTRWKQNINHLIVMLLFILMHFIFLSMYYSDNSVLTERNNVIQHIYQVMIIVMVLMQYYNTLRREKLIETEEQLKSLQSEIIHTYNYYMLADEKFNEISQLRHDVQNQMQAVKSLIAEDENYNEAQNILNHIQKQLSETKTVQFCGNSIINAVLAVKINDVNSYGIETDIILKDCETLPFDNYDLCGLFVSLFDSAVNECKKNSYDDRFIEMRSRIKGEYFILKIQCSSRGETGIKSHRQFSGHDAENSEVNIIENIVKKYDGSFDIIHSGDTMQMTAVMHK